MEAISPNGKSTCLLDDPEVGIVTENDHKVGKCICNLCTCGNHLCPNRSPMHRYNSFETSYGISYQRHKAIPVHKHEPYLPYVPSPVKMDVKSSMKCDYPPPSSTDKPSLSRPRSTSPNFHFICSSSYQQDYPNWGPSDVQHEKHPQLPIRLRDLKFDGQSTYKREFNPSDHHSHSFDNVRTIPVRSRSILGLVRMNYLNESTSRRSYQKYAGYRLNGIVKMKPEEYVRLETPPCHHLTTNHSAFQPVAISEKDPMMLRRRRVVGFQVKKQL